MKWYSVKKYIPPTDSKLFIMTHYGDIWTGKYTEEHLLDDVVFTFISDMDGMVVHGVTHFCVPEPIEIE